MNTILSLTEEDKRSLRLASLDLPEFQFWKKHNPKYLKVIKELFLNPIPPMAYDYTKLAVKYRAPISDHLYNRTLAEYVDHETRPSFITYVNNFYKIK